MSSWSRARHPGTAGQHMPRVARGTLTRTGATPLGGPTAAGRDLLRRVRAVRRHRGRPGRRGRGRLRVRTRLDRARAQAARAQAPPAERRIHHRAPARAGRGRTARAELARETMARRPVRGTGPTGRRRRPPSARPHTMAWTGRSSPIGAARAGTARPAGRTGRSTRRSTPTLASTDPSTRRVPAARHGRGRPGVPWIAACQRRIRPPTRPRPPIRHQPSPSARHQPSPSARLPARRTQRRPGGNRRPVAGLIPMRGTARIRVRPRMPPHRDPDRPAGPTPTSPLPPHRPTSGARWPTSCVP